MEQAYLSPKNDYAFKKIFGEKKNKAILLHFLNDVLDHAHIGHIVDLTFINPWQAPDLVGDKASMVDVLCTDAAGHQYIVEMQTASAPGFIKRAQYYAAKAYTSQMKKGAPYEGLKEVIFLAITDFVLFPESKAIKSDHVILDKANHAHYLKDFSFTFVELPKFQKSFPQLSGNLDQWWHFLKNAPTTTPAEHAALVQSLPILQQAYQVLDDMAMDKEERLRYDQAEKYVRYYTASLIGAERKGLAKGMAKGKAAGRKEGEQAGLAKGRQAERLALARKLKEKGMDQQTIQQLTGLSGSQVAVL